MIAILDGDIYSYRVGFTTNDVDLGIALWRLDEMVSNTLEEVKATQYKIYLTDSEGNFRAKLYPAYKANRVQPKPKWLEELKEHLIVNWGASISLGQEADDSLGIEQEKNWIYFQNQSVICSIDKDLLQIAGHHYNFVKKEWKYVTSTEGRKWFYTQLLTGDVVDNIKGVSGIGIKKAEKILTGCTEETSLFEATREAYERGYGEAGISLLSLYGKLLKIRTIKDEVWTFPKLDIQLQ